MPSRAGGGRGGPRNRSASRDRAEQQLRRHRCRLALAGDHTELGALGLAADRPDLVQVGSYASNYGFVMNGGTAAKALSVYELQAKEFTGYWSGQQSLDDALKNTEKGMSELLK